MMRTRQKAVLIFLVLLVACGSGLGQTPQAGPDNPRARLVRVSGNAAANGPSANNKAPGENAAAGHDVPALQDRYPRYQVQPSDVLAVTFPLIPEIQTVSVTVQPDGFITLPNGAGTIYVKGQTIPQIIDALKQAYSSTMHNPIVTVDVTNFQPPQFTVNGQVGKPGQYPLRIDTTVSEGIAVAGGFLPSAKTQVFLLRRVSSDWMEVRKLKLRQLLDGRDVKEDVHLQAGDMIYVPNTFISSFRKYVPYGVGLGSSVGWSGNGLIP